MKIKTADLTGPALDWAVASIEVLPKEYLFTFHGKPFINRECFGRINTFQCEFSSNWSQGGPLIEREGIELRRLWHNQVGVMDPTWQQLGYASAAGYHYCANIQPNDRDGDVWIEGPTPLVAAMRCLIAHRMGEEIDIPEELLPTGHRP